MIIQATEKVQFTSGWHNVIKPWIINFFTYTFVQAPGYQPGAIYFTKKTL
jgi:hypothetical protein